MYLTSTLEKLFFNNTTCIYLIDQIEPKTIDHSMRLTGNNYRVCGVYCPEPQAEVYGVKLNFHVDRY